jgi:hypothetical protein
LGGRGRRQALPEGEKHRRGGQCNAQTQAQSQGAGRNRGDGPGPIGSHARECMRHFGRRQERLSALMHRHMHI